MKTLPRSKCTVRRKQEIINTCGEAERGGPGGGGANRCRRICRCAKDSDSLAYVTTLPTPLEVATPPSGLVTTTTPELVARLAGATHVMELEEVKVTAVQGAPDTVTVQPD